MTITAAHRVGERNDTSDSGRVDAVTGSRIGAVERTSLAWSRTTVAALAVSGLAVLKNYPSQTGSLGLFTAGTALTVGLINWLLGTLRHSLRRCPAPRHINPRREVQLVGISVVALSFANALAEQL